MNVLAMILAGGRVDELDVLTFFRPKSVMPFGALYRFIDFPLSNLMHSGIEQVGILSQYRPFRLITHLANGEPWDMVGRNRFVSLLPPYKGGGKSDWYKGTADAVYQNLDFIDRYKPDLVLILSGDHIYHMDYQKLIAFHREKKAHLTVAFTRIPKEGSHRFGQALIDDEDPRGGPVVKYAEKPQTPLSEWASLTIYLFDRTTLIDILNENAPHKSHEFGKDILPSLVNRKRVYGFKHEGYWGYARTIEEYWQTNMDLLGNKPRLDIGPWEVRTNLADRAIRDRQPAHIGQRASIEDSIFYSGCELNGRVVRSILFPGAKVEEGAIVEDSILFFDTVVKKDALVTRCISDTGATIGAEAHIGEGRSGALSVIGTLSSIPDGIHMASGVTVYPRINQNHFTRTEYGSGEIIK